MEKPVTEDYNREELAPGVEVWHFPYRANPDPIMASRIDVSEFKESVEKDIPEAEIEQKINFIYNFIDSRLLENKFDTINQILKELVVDKVPVDLLISVTCITYAARDKLPERSMFFQRARDSVLKRLGVKESNSIFNSLR